jgi:hypothetical protein
VGDQTSFGTWNAARAAQFGCGFLAGNPALRYVHPENIGSIHFPPPAEVEEASSSDWAPGNTRRGPAKPLKLPATSHFAPFTTPDSTRYNPESFGGGAGGSGGGR